MIFNTYLPTKECKGFVTCQTDITTFKKETYHQFSPIRLIEPSSGTSIAFWDGTTELNTKDNTLVGINWLNNQNTQIEKSWSQKIMTNIPIYLASVDGNNWSGIFPSEANFKVIYDGHVWKGVNYNESNNWKFTIIMTLIDNSWWLLNTLNTSVTWYNTKSSIRPSVVDVNKLWLLLNIEEPHKVSPLFLGDIIAISQAFPNNKLPTDSDYLNMESFAFLNTLNECQNDFLSIGLYNRNDVEADDYNILTGSNKLEKCSDNSCKIKCFLPYWRIEQKQESELKKDTTSAMTIFAVVFGVSMFILFMFWYSQTLHKK